MDSHVTWHGGSFASLPASYQKYVTMTHFHGLVINFQFYVWPQFSGPGWCTVM